MVFYDCSIHPQDVNNPTVSTQMYHANKPGELTVGPELNSEVHTGGRRLPGLRQI